MAARMYEMLMVHDWVDAKDHKQRQRIEAAVAVFESVRQLLCTAAFARCSVKNLPGKALELVYEVGMRVAPILDDDNIMADWESGMNRCKWGHSFLLEDSELRARVFSACFSLAMAWTERIYRQVVGPFVDPETGVQTAESAAEASARKVSASVGYPALVYPPELSPSGVCAFEGVPRPLFGGEAFNDVASIDVLNQRSRHLNIISLLELFENGKGFAARHPRGLSGVAVNIGANDGVCRVGHGVDPVNCLVAAGASGVLVEADGELGAVIQEVVGHRSPDVQIVIEAVTPATAATLLREALERRPGQPLASEELDLIKVDIDGLDCEIIASLTQAGWRPKVWHVEINPLFPPGVAIWPREDKRGGSYANESKELMSAFSRRQDPAAPGADGRRQKMVGCSIQALLDELSDEYRLLHIEVENAVFVRRDMAQTLEPWISYHDDMTKWRIGYFCHPLGRLRMPGDKDDASLFLRYDFRLWGDPSVPVQQVQSDVRLFLAEFIEHGSYRLAGAVAMESTASSPAAALTSSGLQADATRWAAEVVARNASQLEDPNCEASWKGTVLEWDVVLRNTGRVLNSWATGDGMVGPTLAAMVEDIVSRFDIDRAWPVFKLLVAAECPLGGMAIAAVLRWCCVAHKPTFM
eukprot:TRINITY_DN11044_c0_g2_i1.p1 TRINITY_DN11044_c0_g2~~TRINITY_DN11044_c0_g2_i1.p1  ORF type:complete len:736 (-),score=140.90 TRINITY_DN11044_c0_g2_i1:959-2881(-)